MSRFQATRTVVDAHVALTPVRADRVYFKYSSTDVLQDFSLGVAAGEFVAIVGASGSGKTTALQCMSGLLEPTSGSIHLTGHDTATLDRNRLANLRLSSVGFVFQSADLVPELTLAENVELPLRLTNTPRKDRVGRLHELVTSLGLEEAASRRPHEVSGGQAQRAAIGRALAVRPQVVFADEPTGALDSVNRSTVMSLLTSSVRRDGAALVLVTHDPDVAERADRVVRMVDGRVSSE